MNVLLDATAATNGPTGVGRYIEELVPRVVATAPDLHFALLLRPELRGDHVLRRLAADATNVSVRERDLPPVGARRDLSSFRWPYDYDVYHCLHSAAPLFVNRRVIVTIHDLKYVLFPNLIGRAKARYLDAVLRHVARRAEAVICVSEATRRDFAARYGAGRMPEQTVIHEAASLATVGLESPIPSDPPRDGGYFLYVGELRPHKNVDGLLSAYEIYRRRIGATAMRLHIVGPRHKSFGGTLDGADGVDYLGTLPDAALLEEYRGALALVLPSKYEGFGLPILEAMSVETPVITSSVSSMPEVAGDAALLVDPAAGPQPLADALERMATDGELRTELSRRGMERAAQFSWERAAEQTVLVYRTVVSRMAENSRENSGEGKGES